MQISKTLAKSNDFSAVSLSVLCVIHCLVIPIFAVALPASLVWFGQEWIHQLLVLIAVPISGYAIAISFANKEDLPFVVLACAGLALMLAAAFLHQLHDVETPLTVLGASLLAGAHIYRSWRRHQCSIQARDRD